MLLDNTTSEGNNSFVASFFKEIMPVILGVGIQVWVLR